MAEALSPILEPSLEWLTHRVLREACDRQLTLATAESCTGGLIASLLTDVPGCSHAFERGFVTYTNDAKAQMLGVPEALLDQDGPVSEAAARVMAEGALAHSAADIALSVTGWAEAGPAPGQEAGLVWFGVATRGGETNVRSARLGDIGRADFRLGCIEIALQMLAGALGVAI